MKRIIVFLTPVLIAAVMYGCSKDHESPTFSKYEGFMKKPETFEASFQRSTDEFSLKWTMPDTNSVTKYYIAWSDSNVFDLGKRASIFTETAQTDYTVSVSQVLRSLTYEASKDSFIVYFTVAALYSNETFNEFIGPRSVVDSALVYKK